MRIGSMLYDAALSAVLAVQLVRFALHERRPVVLGGVSLSGLPMPLCWNAILPTTGPTAQFSHDLPLPPFPISWHDIGSGVFTLARAATSRPLGVAPARKPDRRVAYLAITTGRHTAHRHLRLPIEPRPEVAIWQPNRNLTASETPPRDARLPASCNDGRNNATAVAGQ